VAGTLALPAAEDGAPPRALLPPGVAGPFGECFPVVCRRAPPDPPPPSFPVLTGQVSSLPSY
jgi:hypothetical protein